MTAYMTAYVTAFMTAYMTAATESVAFQRLQLKQIITAQTFFQRFS